MARQDDSWAAQQIQSFMVLQRERVLVKKELAAGTARNFLKPIKAFLQFYDDISNKVPWKRILRSLPRAKQYSTDRAPTIEEIRKLVEYPDRRLKAIVYTMCSSGIRVGAWDFIQWKHIEPKYNKKTGEIVAAKLKVYAGEEENYDAFITPEAYHAIKEWMDFRASYGEEITPDSWVMRNMFRTTDVKRQRSKNDNFYATVKNPERLSSGSVKRILVRAFYEQGLRQDLAEGSRRHEFKGTHGFRKFYKTRAEQVMNRLNVEFLMGHSIGLNSNYYRPTQQELLEDYLKAVPALTISEDFANIRKQQEILQEKEHKQEKQIEALQEKYDTAYESYSFFFQKSQIFAETFEMQKQAIASLKDTVKKLEEKIEQQQQQQEKT
jgi:integrase